MTFSGWGDIPEYFSWQMLLIFFGVWLLLSFKLVSAVIFFAIGFWFLMPDMAIQLTESYKKIYWPVVLILCGSGIHAETTCKKLQITVTFND